MRLLPLSKYKIYGNSMLPTLKPGQMVLTQNLLYKIKINDLVVVKVGNKEVIKRVNKISGDKLYVVGDNKKESTDSRYFGWVDRSAIIGKVVYGSKKDTAY